jgi:hypothetical protein
VRRYLLPFFACLPLIALAAAPAFTIVPTVIVYPAQASGDQPGADAIARMASVIADEIGKGGQVRVLTAKPGIAREAFRTDARAQGADYYITGFVTPIGDSVSVIEQVVSVSSGTVLFSRSAQIKTYGELLDPADSLRAGILDASSRGLAAFEAPTPTAATPAPEPASGTDVSVSGLFGRRKHAADSPVAILAVGGSADADQRAAAARALAGAFGRDGRRAVIVSDSAPSNDVCVANKANSLVAASLDTQTTDDANASASLRLVGYDCSGKVAFDRSFTTSGSGPDAAQAALAGVSDAAVGAYINPANPAKP